MATGLQAGKMGLPQDAIDVVVGTQTHGRLLCALGRTSWAAGPGGGSTPPVVCRALEVSASTVGLLRTTEHTAVTAARLHMIRDSGEQGEMWDGSQHQ